MEENTKEEELSREWVLDNFRLRDNPIIKANPEVGEELIQTLQKKGQTFKGGAVRDQVIGQGVAGRTDWIVARVELKPWGRDSGQHEATGHESRRFRTADRTTQALAGARLD